MCSDFSNAKSQDAAKRLALAQEIREACMNVGFFYSTSNRSTFHFYRLTWDEVKNHGVDQELINEARKNLEEFFALPLEEKQKVFHSFCR